MLDRITNTGRGLWVMSTLGGQWPKLLGRDRTAVLFAAVVALVMMTASALLEPYLPESPYLIADPTFMQRWILQWVDMATIVSFALICAQFSSDSRKGLTLFLGLVYIGVPLGVLLGLIGGAHMAVLHFGLLPLWGGQAIQLLGGLLSFILIASVFRTALGVRALGSLGLTLLLMVCILAADWSVQYLWINGAL